VTVNQSVANHLRGSFFATLSPQRLRRVREKHGRGTQGKAKIPFATFVWALVVHALSADGTIGAHLRSISGVKITDSAAHQRRQGLSWAWFEEIFSQVLKPLARRGTDSESFYKDLRLLAIDGSNWSLRNTTEIVEQSPARHGNQRGSSAGFIKWGCAVLLETGTHQPLAVARSRPVEQSGSRKAEGELTIARRLLPFLPKNDDVLVLMDRLYGNGDFVLSLRDTAGGRCHVLVRVNKAMDPSILEILSDGSALIKVKVRKRGRGGKVRRLKLREIRGLIGRDGKQTPIRLWTTLLDEVKYPAAELLALYASRWEEELFFRELKIHTGREQLLRAGTLQGAEAELGALILAASLLARQRLKAAESVGLPPLRLSIAKLGGAVNELVSVLSVAGSIISPRQRELIVERFMQNAAREASIPPRRERSCQRGLRKPASAWPRIRTREYVDGPSIRELIPITFP
jgi:hypothetical protein